MSAGQRALLRAIERLAELSAAGIDPAVSFCAARWTAATADGFDLEAAAAASAASEPAPPAKPHRDGAPTRRDLETGPIADGSPRPTGDGAGLQPGQVPAALPGVVETAARINAREIDPLALVDRVLSRIEALDPLINAVVTACPERARQEAARVIEVLESGERPRPLAGVPMLHKDILCTRGVRTAAGSALLAHHVPGEDAGVVARLANAGVLTVGKANTHEFATGTTGTVSWFGAVRNPWDRERVAGGSSSGSAAALAARLVPGATGSDTGGSIRIPAACCGIVGLKPTFGRVGRVGVVPFAWSLDHVGPMACNVADVAVLLGAMAGHDPRDGGSVEEPAGDFRTGLGDRLEGLRFAVPERFFLALARADVAAAVRRAAAVLEELGAQRIDVAPPRELADVGPIAIAIFLAEGGAVHERQLRERPRRYLDETRAFLSLAQRVDAPTYVHAQRLRARLAAAMARMFREVDVLVTPTLPITAPRLDERQVRGPDGPIDVRAAMTLFTRPFNLTGLPALSLPCGFDSAGLPIGLQLVGRPFDEATVLAAGHAYERVTEWHLRRPPGFGDDPTE